MTVDELRALIVARRDLAEQATPGPWADGEFDSRTLGRHWIVYRSEKDQRGKNEQVVTEYGIGADGRNTAHIAANDPATVIRNCDEDLAVLDRHNHSPFSYCDDAQSIARRYGVELT